MPIERRARVGNVKCREKLRMRRILVYSIEITYHNHYDNVKYNVRHKLASKEKRRRHITELVEIEYSRGHIICDPFEGLKKIMA